MNGESYGSGYLSVSVESVSVSASRSYDRAAVVNKRLELFNEVALPFLRYNREYRSGDSFLSSYSRRKLPHTPRLLEYEPPTNPKVPVGYVLLRFSSIEPKINDLWIVVYTSAQRSKKRPSQAEKIERTTKRFIAKRLREENKDREVLMALVAPKGATRGAYRELRERHFLVARKPDDLVDLVAGWLENKRWDRLWAKLRGKRVYGPLALLMLILAELLRQLGYTVTSTSFLLRLLEAAIDPAHAVTLPDKPPPPLEDVYQKLELIYESEATQIHEPDTGDDTVEVIREDSERV